MRSIRSLRENYEGKLYVWCGNEEVEKRFLRDAQEEGYRFGTIDPTESHQANIIAVEGDLQLSYVTTTGRTAFQCGKADRIDYGRYCDDSDDYLI